MSKFILNPHDLPDTRWVDSHTHFSLIKEKIEFNHVDKDKKAHELGAFLHLMKYLEKKFQYILDVGIEANDFEERWNLLKQYPFIYYSIGMHPHVAKASFYQDLDILQKILDKELPHNPRIIALGEMGLDKKPYTDLDKQKILLDNQLHLNQKYQLPIIIHNNQCDQLILDLLHNKALYGGVFHCFSSDYAMASKVLDLGFYISFSGNISFKPNTHLRDLVNHIPLDRILIETDAPFLCPHPWRGHINHSAYISVISSLIADIKKCSLDILMAQIEKNFLNAFRLPH